MKEYPVIAFICLSGFLAGINPARCQESPATVAEKTFSAGPVTITDKGSYYFVTLDYTGKVTPREMGEQYGRCILQVVPDFESVIGYYLFEIATLEGLWGNIVPDRTHILQANLDRDSRDELDGLTSVMTTWRAPQCFAMPTAMHPIGPAPVMSTSSPSTGKLSAVCTAFPNGSKMAATRWSMPGW